MTSLLRRMGCDVSKDNSDTTLLDALNPFSGREESVFVE